MPVFYYAGVYLGLIAIHKQSSDKVWTELAWSPDTKKWYRIDAGNPLIPTPTKSWITTTVVYMPVLILFLKIMRYNFFMVAVTGCILDGATAL